jgi:hypothetical protein
MEEYEYFPPRADFPDGYWLLYRTVVRQALVNLARAAQRGVSETRTSQRRLSRNGVAGTSSRPSRQPPADALSHLVRSHHPHSHHSNGLR